MIHLLSFTPETLPFKLLADISFSEHNLIITYNLAGDISAIENGLHTSNWQGSQLQRADELWKNTCFEAFWALPGNQDYWEFNFSTLGKWNLYHFDSYRSPQPPKPSQDFDLITVESTDKTLICTLAASTSVTKIEASICTIIKTKSQTHYLSSKHAGTKPDFHLRNSMTLERGQK